MTSKAPGERPQIAAVILAAGAGKRMGGRPKALLQWNGTTFLERVVSLCRQTGLDPIVVVTRADTPEIEALARALKTIPVENPNPDQGMFSSVQVGIRAALDTVPQASAPDAARQASPPDTSPQAPALDTTPRLAAFLVYPVDHPRVAPSTLLALRDRFHREPAAQWVRPTWNGRGGHPILLATAAARTLLGWPPTESLREALDALGYSPRSVPVDDPHVLTNLNTPADLA